SIKGMTGFGDPATWKNQGSKSVVSSVRRKDTGSCLFSRSSSGRLPTERYKDTISVITNGSRRTVDHTDRPRIAFEKTSLPASKPFPRLRVMKCRKQMSHPRGNLSTFQPKKACEHFLGPGPLGVRCVVNAWPRPRVPGGADGSGSPRSGHPPPTGHHRSRRTAPSWAGV